MARKQHLPDVPSPSQVIALQDALLANDNRLLETANADAVRAVIGHVHQIGWQLRLGEHIEGNRQLQSSQDVPRHPTRRSRACGA